MWRCRSAKQRVWLGPGRYRGRCRDAVTNSVADSYANSNSYTFCLQRGDGNANTYGHCNCNSYANSDSHRHCNCYANCDSYAYAEAGADTEASSYAAAETLILE